MIDLVTRNLKAIQTACEDHDVNTLWVFGSAVTGEWVEDKSDVDFLVSLGESSMSLFDQYLGLIVALDKVLGRHDIAHATRVEELGEGRFAEEVLRTRVKVYENSHQRVPA